MSINTAFYQIAKNVAASDLAKIIGAKITGIETTVNEKALSKILHLFTLLQHQHWYTRSIPNCWLVSNLKQQSSSRTRPERRRWVQKTSV